MTARAPKYDRDPGLEPRAGDRVARPSLRGAVVREVVRTFFSPFARERFVVYRRPSGQCASLALGSWRRWAGAA
jgi:hypothetical protein